MSRLVREPLVHFMLLGALLFTVDRLRADDEEEAPVVLTDAFVAGLRREVVRATGRDAEGEEALVRAFLREEALVRDAQALGLGEGDVIVRRRLAQKMEFLLRSTADVAPPSDAQLLSFLRAHPGRYRLPPRVTFEQIYFDRGRRADARADARAALERLRTDDDVLSESVGDPFLRGYRFPDFDARRVERELGPEVAQAVDAAPLDAWYGPVEGVLGVHLVRVRARTESREPPLADVHARVAADWEDARRDEALEAAVTERVARLPVERTRE